MNRIERLMLISTLIAGLGRIPTALSQNAVPPKSEAFASVQVMEQIAAIGREKDSWTPAQRKINSKLLLETKKRLRRPIAVGVPEMRSTVKIDETGRTLVDINATVADHLLRRIRELGGQVINSHVTFNSVRALVPLEHVEILAAEPAVTSIRPADEAVLHKTNTSQGVVAHRADLARTNYGVNGTGVRIGVLSDSVESLAALQATGDLPAGVTVLSGQAGSGTSEGTAMLEIAYDIAPGASLYFATAYGGQAQFAQNILDLLAAGCNVIVDDVGYYAEPTFQDGIIAQAVETVTAAGAVYFSAAGNEGNLNDGTSGVWEGDFLAAGARPTPITSGTAHDFGTVNYNSITVDSPSLFTLKWSDASGASSNDYDLYLLNSSRTLMYDLSINVQDGNDDPYEAISSSGYIDTGNTLVIIQKVGAAARFLHLNSNGGRLSRSTAGQTYGHSAAVAALSVAAVNVATAGGGAFIGGAANPVETFSSDGPRQVFYAVDGTPITPGNFTSTGGTVRQKPDIAAADNVSCATPDFNPFPGTSAAAPHAAGIAALMLAKGATSPVQIRQAMTSTAWDIEATGVDRDSGHGIINAYAAVGSVVGPPTDITLSNSTVAENQPSNTLIGGFTTTDPDAGDTFTYSLAAGGADNARFTIQPGGNTLLAGYSFDYETKNSFSIRVRSTDPGGLYVEKAFTISIAQQSPLSVILVDRASTAPFPNGTTWAPYPTVLQGYSAAQAGATLRIASGDYPEKFDMNKQVTIEAQTPGGVVNIGKGVAP